MIISTTYGLYGAFQDHLIRQDCLEAITTVRDRDYRQMEPSHSARFCEQIWDPILLRHHICVTWKMLVKESALTNNESQSAPARLQNLINNKIHTSEQRLFIGVVIIDNQM